MGRQKEVAAWQMHRGLVDSAVGWIKDKAKSIEQFPRLPNGRQGLEIGKSSTALYRLILRPEGDLTWVMHDSYEFRGRLRPVQYLSQTVFDGVEDAVDKYNEEHKLEARTSRFGFFGRPQTANSQQ